MTPAPVQPDGQSDEHLYLSVVVLWEHFNKVGVEIGIGQHFLQLPVLSLLRHLVVLLFLVLLLGVCVLCVHAEHA